MRVVVVETCTNGVEYKEVVRVASTLEQNVDNHANVCRPKAPWKLGVARARWEVPGWRVTLSVERSELLAS
jgi:hypothetical protein